jgi:hypothetical protein
VGTHLEGQEKSLVGIGVFWWFPFGGSIWWFFGYFAFPLSDFLWRRHKMPTLSILEEDMTPQGALDHLVNVVLPNDTIELQTFFQYNGITDLDDFMTLIPLIVQLF